MLRGALSANFMYTLPQRTRVNEGNSREATKLPLLNFFAQLINLNYAFFDEGSIKE